MKLRTKIIILLATIAVVLGAIIIPNIAHIWYTKQTYMIEMRDGVHLHTTVYSPRFGDNHPIMLFRTPYGSHPYGKAIPLGFEKGYMNRFIAERYIIVIQDVRGRYMSEGEFEHVRPYSALVSEESDTYDTVEWLIANLQRTNHRVGLGGCSYPGFYALAGAACGHSAIKAVSAQAPVTDWFMGDDAHHNGVLMLSDFFSFIATLDLGNHVPYTDANSKKYTFSPDEYSCLLRYKSLSRIASRLPDGAYSETISQHPDYDLWWQERNLASRLDSIRCPVMITGGHYDAEDLYGTWKTFRTIQTSSLHPSFLVIGPWSHSAWKGNGKRLGDFNFGHKASSRFYSKHFEMPFLNFYLKDNREKNMPSPVSVFITGSNTWYTSEDWDQVGETKYYLSVDHSLRQFPCGGALSYISDPSNPVPYYGKIGKNRNKAYMNADQRFVSGRKDVLEYYSEPFETDTTFAGPINVHLRASISTTDIDFTVRIIDCYGLQSAIHGYEMLVRADVMRARYRNSFSTPKPVLPNEDFSVDFTLPDIAHTFRAGHRLKICVQSSWFPIVELSPQQYTDFWTCTLDHFVSSTVKIYGTSSVTFHHLNSNLISR